MKNGKNCLECQHHVVSISDGVKVNGCHLGSTLNSEEMRFNFLLVNKLSDGKCVHFKECDDPVPLIEEWFSAVLPSIRAKQIGCGEHLPARRWQPNKFINSLKKNNYESN